VDRPCWKTVADWLIKQDMQKVKDEQVAMLIGESDSCKEISEILCISEKSISKHRGNILKKLKIKNTAQLIKYEYDSNLVG
jgi:two-component system response regulator NreC